MTDSYDWKKVLLRVMSVKQGQKMLERILSHTVRVVVCYKTYSNILRNDETLSSKD